MRDATDDALIIAAGRGDRAAASQLIIRHTEKIHGLCRRMLGSQSAAEDATQETFLRLWRNAGRWRPGKAQVSTWLHKVAMNICIDQLRATRPQAEEAAAEALVDDAPLQDDLILARERRSAIDEAMARLPERQRAAIILVNFQDLSNIEAAQALDISVDALESLLARGRRTLKNSLAPMRESLTGRMSDEREQSIR